MCHYVKTASLSQKSVTSPKTVLVMIDFDVTYDFGCEWLPILRIFEVIEFEMTPKTVFFEKKKDKFFVMEI